MNPFDPVRRRVLGYCSGLAAGLALTDRAAATLMPTPRQTAGPFYPDQLPLDTDNDLLRIFASGQTAKGIVAHVHGQIQDLEGRPLAGLLVEIWQCDANGRYRHTGDRRDVALDPGFQGYGKTVTDHQGRYRFRTIRPVAYPGRAPHIHFAVKPPEEPALITQMYVAGDPLNDRDALLNRIRDRSLRQRLLVPMEAHPEHPGELVGQFDIVLAASV
jgi:protocatechuate 3,4-dioxygenase beta subunit